MCMGSRHLLRFQLYKYIKKESGNCCKSPKKGLTTVPSFLGLPALLRIASNFILYALALSLGKRLSL